MQMLVFLLTGGVATACSTAALDRQPSIADARIVEWVEKTVAERRPTAQDKQFDRIAWVSDIRTAVRLGKEYNRPIFLYTGDGRINTGRC